MFISLFEAGNIRCPSNNPSIGEWLPVSAFYSSGLLLNLFSRKSFCSSSSSDLSSTLGVSALFKCPSKYVTTLFFSTSLKWPKSTDIVFRMSAFQGMCNRKHLEWMTAKCNKMAVSLLITWIPNNMKLMNTGNTKQVFFLNRSELNFYILYVYKILNNITILIFHSASSSPTSPYTHKMGRKNENMLIRSYFKEGVKL